MGTEKFSAQIVHRSRWFCLPVFQIYFLQPLSFQGPEQHQLVCGIVRSLNLVLVYLNLYLPNESIATEHPLESQRITDLRTNEIQPSLECKNL